MSSTEDVKGSGVVDRIQRSKGLCGSTDCFGDCPECLDLAYALGGRGAARSFGDIYQVFDGNRWRTMPDSGVDDLKVVELMDVAERARDLLKALGYNPKKSLRNLRLPDIPIKDLALALERYDTPMDVDI